MATLTGASVVITLSIAGLFPAPIRLQGFAADDVYDMDSLESAETLMGVDGVLSGGYTWKPIQQGISLQSDSASNLIFEQWYAAQVQQLDTLTANGRTNIVSTGRTYVMTNGFLTGYQPAPAVGKLLRPRKFQITWERITSTPNG